MALPNEFERKLITQLRSSCRDVLKEMDSDPSDMYLVRWLRARDYNMKQAEKMLRDNRKWKKQHKVGKILDNGLDTFLKLNYPLHLGIVDKRSRPVVILPIGRWNLKQAVSNGLSNGFRTYVIQCMEAVMKSVEIRDTLRKPCAMPVTQFTVMLDFEGFPSSQLLDIRVLRAIHQTLSTLQSNYPRTVAACLCINCPLVIAKSIQCLLAPVISSKSSSSPTKGNVIWCGRVEKEDELRTVLRKFVPEKELEKCVYLLRAD